MRDMQALNNAGLQAEAARFSIVPLDALQLPNAIGAPQPEGAPTQATASPTLSGQPTVPIPDSKSRSKGGISGAGVCCCRHIALEQHLSVQTHYCIPCHYAAFKSAAPALTIVGGDSFILDSVINQSFAVQARNTQLEALLRRERI